MLRNRPLKNISIIFETDNATSEMSLLFSALKKVELYIMLKYTIFTFLQISIAIKFA